MAEGLSKNNIEYYYKKNRYLNLLFTSNKWKDIFYSKEAIISFILAALCSCIIGNIYHTVNLTEFCSMIGITLLTVSMGLLGMLGFLVSGLAIMAGTISNKILKNIDVEKKFNHLMNILFAFYFTGSLVGLTLVFFVLTYLSLYTNWEISSHKVYFLSFIGSYLFWFTVVYSIMLLGTCLRLTIVSYRYEYDKNNIVQ